MKAGLIYLFTNFLICGCQFTGELEVALDVVIVADSSDYVGITDWHLEQTVIKNAMSIFRIGTCYTRILGLVRYGTEVAVTLPLVDIKKSNNYNAEKHLDEIELLGGNISNLAAGLDAAADIFGGCFERPDVQNVAIIITSSNNGSKEELLIASERLQKVAFVVTYALDVGRNIQQDEVDIVATTKQAQLHYMKYFDAVDFFRNRWTVKKDCTFKDCHTCPAFYIPGKLKAVESSFFSTVSSGVDHLDQSYLRDGSGSLILDHNDTITIYRPYEDVNFESSGRVKIRNMTYFKFYKICMETLHAEHLYITEAGRDKEPVYTLSINHGQAQHWTNHCIAGSTFYTWRRLQVSFGVLQSTYKDEYQPQVLLRNLYMEGCYSSKKIPFFKEM